MWQVFSVVLDYEDRWEHPLEGEVFADETEAERRCDELDTNSRRYADYFVVRKVDF